MDYSIFRKHILRQTQAWIAETNAGYTVKISTVTENYKDRDVLCMIPDEQSTYHIEGRVYLDVLYEEFLKELKLDSICTKAQEWLLEAIRYNESAGREKVVMTFAEAEETKDLLATYPHRMFHGFAIVYRIHTDRKREYSCFITNKIAQKLGLTEEELYENAFRNTKKYNPPIIQTIGESCYEMMKNSAIDKEIRENLPESLKEDDSMYVIRNQSGMNGAIYLVYENVIEKLAERVGADFYFMPSTIYDMYAVPVKKDEPVDMGLILEESKAPDVSRVEKLSEQVYYYDYREKMLSLCNMNQ